MSELIDPIDVITELKMICLHSYKNSGDSERHMICFVRAVVEGQEIFFFMEPDGSFPDEEPLSDNASLQALYYAYRETKKEFDLLTIMCKEAIDRIIDRSLKRAALLLK